MKFRDKEKQLLVDTFIKTGEYVLSIIVLGTIISGNFRLGYFLVGAGIFVFLVIMALYISSKIKNGKEE